MDAGFRCVTRPATPNQGLLYAWRDAGKADGVSPPVHRLETFELARGPTCVLTKPTRYKVLARWSTPQLSHQRILEIRRKPTLQFRGIITMPVAVSVVIPAYNVAATIGQAVDSALAQDFPDKEIIVVNDGSTDYNRRGLAQLWRSHSCNRAGQPRPERSMQCAIGAAQGEYLAFLDSDDYWLPGRIAKTLNAMMPNTAAGLALCDFSIADRDTGRILGFARPGRAPTRRDIFDSWPVMTRTAVRCARPRARLRRFPGRHWLGRGRAFLARRDPAPSFCSRSTRARRLSR